MKNTYQLLSSALFVFILMIGVHSKSNAQCSLISRDENQTQTITSVDCNFPIYETTGNPIVDQAAKSQWVADIQALYPEWKNMTSSYFVVHQSDFDAMPANRQAALTACPSVQIVP